MRIFITGISGTLGTALTVYHAERGDTVFGCARNECNAVKWMEKYAKRATLFVCGAGCLSHDTDIGRLLPTIDKLYHCAATKHVEICEMYPREAIAQNVWLTNDVLKATMAKGIPSVFISSDKACMPSGVYGASKLLGEKIALRNKAAVVRLGNLIGSSGSVFSKWQQSLAKGEQISLTDPDMTRYFISVDDAARFVALTTGIEEGEIVAPIMRSVRMGQVARRLANDALVRIIGARPGETQHQWLFAPGDRVKEIYNETKGIPLMGTPYRYLSLREGYNIDPNGMSSATAARWDMDELLSVAGIKKH